MQRVQHRLCLFLSEQRGQDLAEYALLGVLIAAVAVLAIGGVGTTLANFWAQNIVDVWRTYLP